MSWYLLFWIVSVYFLLIKESAVILYGACAVWIMAILLVKERAFIKSGIFAALSFVAAALSVVIVAWLSGGLAATIELVKNNMGSVATNQYALDYQTGSWHYYFEGLWLMAPATTVLAAVGICMALALSSGRCRLLRERVRRLH